MTGMRASVDAISRSWSWAMSRSIETFCDGIMIVSTGSSSEAILATAERPDVDLFAVASHGRAGIKRAFLGSVAEEVARLSARPVLIVRSQPQP